MGEVYRAKDSRLGRAAAIKVLPEAAAQDPESLARFEREARALAALNHPGIVTIYSVEEAGDTRFLAMELVQGETLDTAIAPGGFPLLRFFEVAVPLADALSAAHEQGIVHRDLKPANVMITREGRIKVLDFGLARIATPVPDSSATGTPTASRLELTGEGSVFGTVAYMSPEQARGEKVDARSDVFSLGVILYQMLAGKRPFPGESAIDVLSAILRDQPVSVTEIRSDLPSELGTIVRRCLEKQPRDRYATARDVFHELRALEAETPATLPIRSAPSSTAVRADSGRIRAEEGFWIAVLPFKVRDADPAVTALGEGLTEDLLMGLSRFSYLRVIAHASSSRYSGEAVDVRSVGRELGARYILDGSLRQAGRALRISVQLIDAASGTQLWAETYNRPFRAEEMFELQDELVPRMVSTIASTHGVLPQSMCEALRSKDPDQLTPYEAVLRAFSHHGTLNADEHAILRSALERAVQQAPGHADCWAMLSLIYREEYAHGYNTRPDPVGRAFEAARRAVEAGPSNHFAYHALASALFFRREMQAFRSAAQRAVELNPMDGFTVAYMGFLTAYAGDWEHGCALASQARNLNPRHPGWYWFPDFFDAYRRGDDARALEIALRIHMPAFWRANLALAAAYGQLGEREPGQRALDQLLALRPGFPREAREELRKWWDLDLTERLLDGLRKAGLDA
jgi:serine/threonine protein kinase